MWIVAESDVLQGQCFHSYDDELYAEEREREWNDGGGRRKRDKGGIDEHRGQRKRIVEGRKRSSYIAGRKHLNLIAGRKRRELRRRRYKVERKIEGGAGRKRRV